MKPVSGKQLCKARENPGWQLVRVKGSHHAFRHPVNPNTVIVPVHGHKDLKRGTQHGIMKDAGLTDDDL